MLKKEIVGVFKTKRTWIFIFIMIMIIFVDLCMVCNQENVWDKRENKEQIFENDLKMKELSEKEDVITVSDWIIHPAKASYLSGSSRGHLTQMLLIWLTPLFVLNLVSDRSVLEYRKGYTNALLARIGRIKYITGKLLSSFIIPFVVFFISLLLNFVAAQIIFKDGYNFQGMEVFAEQGGWFRVMYEKPDMVYLCYILLTSVIAGFCGVISQCLALLSKNYVVTYLIAFFLWMGLVMGKYSIIYLIQPFTEYGIDYMLCAGGIVSAVTVLFLAVIYVLKVKEDEL
ncbi:MAG: hypothetical protein Q4F21_03330 [Lachnospiraceae bacterium]|nr:hypothetical protein [Lachnospiraceae bacterium]